MEISGRDYTLFAIVMLHRKIFACKISQFILFLLTFPSLPASCNDWNFEGLIFRIAKALAVVIDSLPAIVEKRPADVTIITHEIV